MAACIPNMGISPRESYRGTVCDNENQAFAEFKYLEKINYMVMLTQNHIMTGI